MVPKHRLDRNLLLLGSAILITLGVVHQPSVLLFFLSTRETAHALLMCMASFCMAKAFLRLINGSFKTNGLPWYARIRACKAMGLLVVFSWSILFATNFILPQLFGLSPFFDEKGPVFVVLGMVVLWTILLK